MDKEDVFLVKKAKEDPKNYEALYKKYAQKVFNYFWYRVGHQKEVAEDLLQETFLKAYKSLPKFNLRSYSYYSYLLAIAHNVLANYYRKPRPIPLDSLDNIPSQVTQLQEFNRKRNAELLWQAMQRLSQVEKDILLLYYREEFSIKEIARVVGKSENAVKLILSRARKKLANHPGLKGMVSFADYQKKYTKPKFLEKKI